MFKQSIFFQQGSSADTKRASARKCAAKEEPENVGKWIEYYKSHGNWLEYRRERIPLDSRLIATVPFLEEDMLNKIYKDMEAGNLERPIVVEEWSPGYNRRGVSYPAADRLLRFVLEEDDNYIARSGIELGKEDIDAYVLFCPWGEHNSYGSRMARYGRFGIKSRPYTKPEPHELTSIADVPIAKN